MLCLFSLQEISCFCSESCLWWTCGIWPPQAKLWSNTTAPPQARKFSPFRACGGPVVFEHRSKTTGPPQARKFSPFRAWLTGGHYLDSAGYIFSMTQGSTESSQMHREGAALDSMKIPDFFWQMTFLVLLYCCQHFLKMPTWKLQQDSFQLITKFNMCTYSLKLATALLMPEILTESRSLSHTIERMTCGFSIIALSTALTILKQTSPTSFNT